LSPSAFSSWLKGFLAIPETGDWLPAATVSDRSDPHLVHLDGLNLSRAWMLEGIASALPDGDPRIGVIRATANTHRIAGLEGVSPEHYVGSHWLGSFATYLVTRRGIADR
jgi:hypothetical protein